MRKILIGVAAIIAVMLIGWVSLSNSIVRKANAVEMQEANLESALQRRADLIPNLVTVVKNYDKHEDKAIKAVTEARKSMMSAGTLQEQAEANEKLDKGINQLLAVAENYPDLKSSENYQTLMTQLEGSENRINVERQRYNEKVQIYENAVTTFPGSLLGKDGDKYPLFQASNTEVPDVGSLMEN